MFLHTIFFAPGEQPLLLSTLSNPKVVEPFFGEKLLDIVTGCSDQRNSMEFRSRILLIMILQ